VPAGHTDTLRVGGACTRIEPPWLTNKAWVIFERFTHLFNLKNQYKQLKDNSLQFL
jgi:hypothetical protein